MDIRKEFSQRLVTIIQKELNGIEPRFKDEILSVLRNRGVEPDSTPLDFHLYYAFWLSKYFDIPRKEEVVDELTKFMFWFGHHIFTQDDLIDQEFSQQGFSQEDFYKNIIYSDYFLLKASLILNEFLEKSSLNFGKDILKIYGDYIHCLLWEKDHMRSMGAYTEDDVRLLGKKFSPLKIHNLVFTYLSPNKANFEHLNNLDLFLENYHVSMQIIDDIKDWKDDLKNKNFSFFLMEVIQSYNMFEKLNDIEEFERIIYYSDITVNTAKKSLYYLNIARSNISDMQNIYLNEFIREVERVIESIILNQEIKRENMINKISQILSVAV
ncbi:MAG TPA: hypothetical protein VGK06_12210 [Methanosarcina sp.]|jgi:hypothetical protein